MSLITARLDRFAAPERRTMAVACGAHVLHDGFTDLLYVLLPVWQAEFGLGYAEIGFCAFYVGSMAGFQVPAGIIAERFGPRSWPRHSARRRLSGRGASVGFVMLIGALILSAGSGPQCSTIAAIVSRAFSGTARCARRLQFLRRSRQMAFPRRRWLLTRCRGGQR